MGINGTGTCKHSRDKRDTTHRVGTDKLEVAEMADNWWKK